ncbi:chemotaxis protein CheX [Campylobacter canadensis]|uniref:Chemotaxis phosphatase CheX-like domain-containing protein n=1 Tax=Campylobacter canadensis TaxID=449520 RepID=A0ABS7WQZ4_9BACT|nr:chemotaxis protein CheX [Campylobacter canadensis]MBZ7987183.1 hypothetical protein [Campylobacter canadensis]MBZ7994465.1 hypothetical protein [Campylobacter canadensis]MBZ7996448.1 hypothetical protein [Campylobacter canadensis]MBZ7998193.1 hypothetical protein [Campylobacter canadensis]MBZ7999820.1 hypothetical protein [Campylobacter canadensis]
MLDTIDYSVKHFFKHILRSKLEITDKLDDAVYYGSSICLSDNVKDLECYLIFKQDSLKQLATRLLGDEKMDEDDYCDLCKEVANQIIGYAKRLLADAYDDYSISVPEYLGRVKDFKLGFNYEFFYKLDEHTFCVGIVEKKK